MSLGLDGQEVAKDQRGKRLEFILHVVFFFVSDVFLQKGAGSVAETQETSKAKATLSLADDHLPHDHPATFATSSQSDSRGNRSATTDCPSGLGLARPLASAQVAPSVLSAVDAQRAACEHPRSPSHHPRHPRCLCPWQRWRRRIGRRHRRLASASRAEEARRTG